MSGFQFISRDDKDNVLDHIPLRDGELDTSFLTRVAWDYGWKFSTTDSMSRFLEQTAAEHAWDKFNTPENKFLDPKDANTKYGIPGRLSFSSPVRDSVAKILRERKDEEIATQYLLDKAKGAQNLAVFGSELAAGLLDPVNIGAGFFPFISTGTFEAMIARYGATKARAIAGFFEGGVGNLMLEPIIAGQAQNEQADYGPLDSYMNVIAGGAFSSGLHVVGGKLVDWLHGVQQKKHLKALQTAINQAGNGKRVEVSPIIAGDLAVDPDSVALSMDADTTAPAVTTATTAPAATTLPSRSGTIFTDVPEMINNLKLLQSEGETSVTFVDGHTGEIFTGEILSATDQGLVTLKDNTTGNTMVFPIDSMSKWSIPHYKGKATVDFYNSNLYKPNQGQAANPLIFATDDHAPGDMQQNAITWVQNNSGPYHVALKDGTHFGADTIDPKTLGVVFEPGHEVHGWPDIDYIESFAGKSTPVTNPAIFYLEDYNPADTLQNAVTWIQNNPGPYHVVLQDGTSFDADTIAPKTMGAVFNPGNKGHGWAKVHGWPDIDYIESFAGKSTPTTQKPPAPQNTAPVLQQLNEVDFDLFERLQTIVALNTENLVGAGQPKIVTPADYYTPNKKILTDVGSGSSTDVTVDGIKFTPFEITDSSGKPILFSLFYKKTHENGDVNYWMRDGLEIIELVGGNLRVRKEVTQVQGGSKLEESLIPLKDIRDIWDGDKLVFENYADHGPNKAVENNKVLDLPDQRLNPDTYQPLGETITIKGSKDPETGAPYKIIPALKTDSGDLILYHGGQTLTTDFNRGSGITWLTSLFEHAEHYSVIMNGNIQKAVVTVKNPLDISLPSWEKKLIKILKDAGLNLKKDPDSGAWTTEAAIYWHDRLNPQFDYVHSSDLLYDPEVVQVLRNAGYDALIYLEGAPEGGSAWVQNYTIFDPKQIKASATMGKKEPLPKKATASSIPREAPQPFYIKNSSLYSTGTGQLGSNPGGVYTDKVTGKTYYVKFPEPDKIEQARQEFLASVFYRMANQDIPEIRPVMEGKNFIGIASEWQEKATTFDVNDYQPMFKALQEIRSKDPQTFERFVRGLVMHMWLANWDWASPNNIVITADGRPMWIDYGATLQYRASGIKKNQYDAGAAFNEFVHEFKYYYDPQSAPFAVQHFQRMKDFIDFIGDNDLWQRGVNDLISITDDDISNIVWKMGLSNDDAADISSVLIARRLSVIDHLKDLIDTNAKLKKAEFFTYPMIQAAVHAAAKVWKPLIQAVKDALHNYKGLSYQTLNSWLRGTYQVNHLSEKQHLQQLSDLMDKATEGFQFPEEAYIWRGHLHISKFTLVKQLGVTLKEVKDLDIGAIRKKVLGSGQPLKFHDPGFLSSTADVNIARHFTYGPGGDVMLRIRVPKGQNAAVPAGLHTTPSDGEAEFVLPRNTTFAITDVYKDIAQGTERIVFGVKVVPNNAKIQPMTSKAAMKAAEKHWDSSSNAADESLLSEELTYSLKDAMGLKEDAKIIEELNTQSDETLQQILESSPLERESLSKMIEQLNTEYGRMVEQGNALSEGAMAAYPCVLKHANL